MPGGEEWWCQGGEAGLPCRGPGGDQLREVVSCGVGRVIVVGGGSVGVFGVRVLGVRVLSSADGYMRGMGLPGAGVLLVGDVQGDIEHTQPKREQEP